MKLIIEKHTKIEDRNNVFIRLYSQMGKWCDHEDDHMYALQLMIKSHYAKSEILSKSARQLSSSIWTEKLVSLSW